MKCVYLKNVKYLHGYKLFVEFNDGKSGSVDLEDIVINNPKAESLRDPRNFSRFFLDSWPTLAWDCGFDIAPEAIYERC